MKQPPLKMTNPYKDPMKVLRDRIEDLPGIVGIGTSDRALNIFNGEHVQFANGRLKHEGQTSGAFDGDVEATANDTFQIIEIHRRSIPGDVFLTWRIYPELSEQGIYTRLSFTPVADVLARFGK